jgi:hypothetical protein
MSDFVARLLGAPGPWLRPLAPNVFDPAAPRLPGGQQVDDGWEEGEPGSPGRVWAAAAGTTGTAGTAVPAVPELESTWTPGDDAGGGEAEPTGGSRRLAGSGDVPRHARRAAETGDSAPDAVRGGGQRSAVTPGQVPEGPLHSRTTGKGAVDRGGRRQPGRPVPEAHEDRVRGEATSASAGPGAGRAAGSGDSLPRGVLGGSEPPSRPGPVREMGGAARAARPAEESSTVAGPVSAGQGGPPDAYDASPSGPPWPQGSAGGPADQHRAPAGSGRSGTGSAESPPPPGQAPRPAAGWQGPGRMSTEPATVQAESGNLPSDSAAVREEREGLLPGAAAVGSESGGSLTGAAAVGPEREGAPSRSVAVGSEREGFSSRAAAVGA